MGDRIRTTHIYAFVRVDGKVKKIDTHIPKENVNEIIQLLQKAFPDINITYVKGTKPYYEAPGIFKHRSPTDAKYRSFLAETAMENRRERLESLGLT